MYLISYEINLLNFSVLKCTVRKKHKLFNVLFFFSHHIRICVFFRIYFEPVTWKQMNEKCQIVVIQTSLYFICNVAEFYGLRKCKESECLDSINLKKQSLTSYAGGQSWLIRNVFYLFEYMNASYKGKI